MATKPCQGDIQTVAILVTINSDCLQNPDTHTFLYYVVNVLSIFM